MKMMWTFTRARAIRLDCYFIFYFYIFIYFLRGGMKSEMKHH